MKNDLHVRANEILKAHKRTQKQSNMRCNFDSVPQVTKRKTPHLLFRVLLGDMYVAGFNKRTRKARRTANPDKAVDFTRRTAAEKVADYLGGAVETVT